MNVGEEKVVRSGRPGVRDVTYRFRLENGHVVKRTMVGKDVHARRGPRSSASAPSSPSACGTGWPTASPVATGHINTGNGYYGGLQFSLGTWLAYGGTGLPSQPAARRRSRSRPSFAPLPAVGAVAGLRAPARPAPLRRSSGSARPDRHVRRVRVSCSGRPTSCGWRPSSTFGRPSSAGRTSSSTRTRCAGSCARPGRPRRRRASRSAPALARSPSACSRPPHQVVAVEIDAVLATALPATVARARPTRPAASTSCTRTRCGSTALPGPPPTALVANLPYNVAVPVLLHLLARCPRFERGLVMVQAEVADRLAAGPGSRTYGVPSVKAAWYADVTPSRCGRAQRLLAGAQRRLRARRLDPARAAGRPRRPREQVFAVVDAAFAQRRKTLRAALAGWPGRPRPPRPRCGRGRRPAARGARRSTSRTFARIAEALAGGGAAAMSDARVPARPGEDQPAPRRRARRATTASTRSSPSTRRSGSTTRSRRRPRRAGRWRRPVADWVDPDAVPAHRRQHRRPGRAACSPSTTGVEPRALGLDRARRSPSRAAWPAAAPTRRPRWSRSTALGPRDLRRRTARPGRRAGQRRPVLPRRRHGARHRPRRAARAGAGPRPVALGVRPRRGGPVHALGLRRVRPLNPDAPAPSPGPTRCCWRCATRRPRPPRRRAPQRPRAARAGPAPGPGRPPRARRAARGAARPGLGVRPHLPLPVPRTRTPPGGRGRASPSRTAVVLVANGPVAGAHVVT